MEVHEQWFEMTDEGEKGFGPWSRVPQWDGSPATWRKFRREVTWWISSIDLSSTTKYNFAARFLLRQEGIARQRGEEFTPDELKFKPEEVVEDPDTGESFQISPPDYLFGLNKLLDAWEGMNGRTALDKRGELRQTFYMDLQRKPGERVSEFATRFRSLVADLRAEGVVLHDNELGWWLKQKLGLDAIRRQLLDTAVQGSEEYGVIEAEILRLFRDLHDNDPLRRRFDQPKLTVRRLFQHQGRVGSSAASTTPSSSYRSTSQSSMSRPSFKSGFSQRQVNVAEAEDELEGVAEEEDVGAGDDSGEAGVALEEVLTTEAEILATELEEAEQEGIDPAFLQELESGLENAAETLVTMREARQQLNTVRKDRGYGKAAPKTGPVKKSNPQTQMRKSSGKFPCFDCNMPGHWAGDPECSMPGAGLGKKAMAAKRNNQTKQVRIAEAAPSEPAGNSTLVAEAGVGLPMHDILAVEQPTLDHDVLVVAAGSEALSLDQALRQNVSQSVLVAGNSNSIPQDKELVGALDSACNRTCAGPNWLNQYLDALKSTPSYIQSLVHVVDESENFRFGNNGVVPSIQRWRLPAMIGQTLVLIWVSLVPVGTLGCLIGRDVLEAVGAIIDFTKRTMVCSSIQSGILQLRQMVAGHFLVELLPRDGQWGPPPQNRWRKIGQDSVLELQLDRRAWIQHRLRVGASSVSEHDHQLTEHGLVASAFSKTRESMLVSTSMTSNRWCHSARDLEHCCDSLDSNEPHRSADMAVLDSSGSLAKTRASRSRPSALALQRRCFVAVAATILAISAIPLSIGYLLQRVVGSNQDDGWKEGVALSSFDFGCQEADCFSSWGLSAPSRPHWLQTGLSGGHHDVDDGWLYTWLSRTKGSSSSSDSGGSSRASQEGCGSGETAGDGEVSGWTSWGITSSERRSDQVGSPAARRAGEQRHSSHDSREADWSGGNDHEGWQAREEVFGGTCSNQDGEGRSTGVIFEAYVVGNGSEPIPSPDANSRTSTRGGGLLDGHWRDRPGHAIDSHGGGWSSVEFGSHEFEPGGDRSDQCRAVGRAAERTSSSSVRLGCGSGGLASERSSGLMDFPEGEAEFGWKWKNKPKPAVSLMISQAWSKHCRDREAVSKSKFEVLSVLVEQWQGEVRQAMNETFLTEIQFPGPFVTEVYTDTEPIASEARRRGLRSGRSLTLSTGWNFLDKQHREKARDEVKRTKPYAVILAFPCNVWSQLLHLNSRVDIEGLRQKARVLVEFAIEIALIQLQQGRHFLMENPWQSAAWSLGVMSKFLDRADVLQVKIDQCRFGLCNQEGKLHRKSTLLVTSSQALVSHMVDKLCTKDHEHAAVIGGAKVTVPAGHYPPSLSKLIVRAFMDQFDYETAFLQQAGRDDSSETLKVEALVGEKVDLEADPLDSDEDEVVGDTAPGEEMHIPASIKSAVYRLHENTGHRSGKRLARALVLCGAPREAVMAAKQLRCSICQERRGPKARRPATLPSVTAVGAQMHVDLLMVEDAFKQTYIVVHATDKVSRYQLAALIPNKSSQQVIRFLSTFWVPLLGVPQIIIADQGREFVSREFEEWCGSHSIYLHHIGVQCPWQNGIAERSGATLKALIGALVRVHSVGGFDEMQIAVAEAVAAYNSDVNEEGVSPIQAVTGRQQPFQGDVLAGVGNRLTEHSLLESTPSLARQVALRETARVAMTRMHFSRGLRRAELARARTTTLTDVPQPGDLCYFWRETKYNPKKARDGRGRRKLQLKRWFGPALMVAVERNPGGDEGANGFLSFRGQLTKCGLEHIRKASSLEQISFGAWEEAIKDVINAADAEANLEVEGELIEEDSGPDEAGQGDLFSRDEVAEMVQPQPLLPISPAEVIAAVQPVSQPASTVTSRLPSRRQSLEPVIEERLTAQPGTPILQFTRRMSETTPGVQEPNLMDEPQVGLAGEEESSQLPSPTPTADQTSSTMQPTLSPMLQQTIQRARSLGREGARRGEKRAASQELAREAQGARGEERSASQDRSQAAQSSSQVAQPAFEALMLSWDQLSNLSGGHETSHPLLQLQVLSEMDRRVPWECLETDHGSWDGRWSFMCERDWKIREALGEPWPCGAEHSHETLNVQASRKEYSWRSLTPADRQGFADAAIQGWSVYLDNGAIEVLSLKQSSEVRRQLAKEQALDKILKPRFVLTDKNDGLRTVDKDLPRKYSARLVVPGFRDRTNLEGKLRRDAPTGSRLAQHLLFSIASWHLDWALLSGDIKSAFMKGDLFTDESRVLFITATDPFMSPPIPLQTGQLARVRKAVFGLADAPREWWLRLCRSFGEHNWERTVLDGATWILWSSTPAGDRTFRDLKGIIVAHVDDLLFAGDPDAVVSFDSIGKELGFGSRESSDFIWCGKRIRRHEDKTIRLSMFEYHKNLKEMYLPKHRKSDVNAALTPGETRSLKALLGSFQWLVAQLRFDMSFAVSSIQGEKPTVSTVLRANSILRQFQQDCEFELIFRPIDLQNCGVVVVSDAALGNVTLEGTSEAPTLSRVYSQACYFVLLAETQMLDGKVAKFNILDARSHRIPRVCRSTYAAETLGAEEGFDIGCLCRGLVATARGFSLHGKLAEKSMEAVKLQIVVDAKDVFDKSNSDTSTYGAQKSMAFTIAWMRSQLRRPNTSMKWTSTENMWVDGGTKLMDLSHMRKIMKSGCWCVSYCPTFVKQVYKASKSPKPSVAVELPGTALNSADPMINHLMKLGEQRGWHFVSNIGIHVAFRAKSFRTPEPRFSTETFPFRSSFARFELESGQVEWRQLEKAVKYGSLANQRALIGACAPVLVTLFHSGDAAQL